MGFPQPEEADIYEHNILDLQIGTNYVSSSLSEFENQSSDYSFFENESEIDIDSMSTFGTNLNRDEQINNTYMSSRDEIKEFEEREFAGENLNLIDGIEGSVPIMEEEYTEETEQSLPIHLSFFPVSTLPTIPEDLYDLDEQEQDEFEQNEKFAFSNPIEVHDDPLHKSPQLSVDSDLPFLINTDDKSLSNAGSEYIIPEKVDQQSSPVSNEENIVSGYTNSPVQNVESVKEDNTSYTTSEQFSNYNVKDTNFQSISTSSIANEKNFDFDSIESLIYSINKLAYFAVENLDYGNGVLTETNKTVETRNEPVPVVSDSFAKELSFSPTTTVTVTRYAVENQMTPLGDIKNFLSALEVQTSSPNFSSQSFPASFPLFYVETNSIDNYYKNESETVQTALNETNNHQNSNGKYSEQELKTFFSAVDRDQDGLINFQEFNEAVTTYM